MSGHALSSPSLPKGSIAIKHRKPKLVRRLHLHSSGPASMEASVPEDIALSHDDPCNWLPANSAFKMASSPAIEHSHVSQASFIPEVQASAPLPPGLPYASVLSR